MSKQYLVGPPGTGKTSRLADRLAELLSHNTRPDRILVLVPQRAQARPFREALARVGGEHHPRGQPDITTLYGLAQQHVSLFFPLIAESAGFADPTGEPVLLNVESAQYLLNRIVQPRRSDFDDLKLHLPRLLSQLIDSMNKAAECGFGLDTIAQRLGSAWSGEANRLISYQRAQEVALDFRRFCLQHSLLDFSLLIDTFGRHLLRSSSYRDYLAARYRHVIADNVEENPPITHDLLGMLLDTCDTALLAEDDPGGFRLFLGADPQSARALAARCDEVVRLDEPLVAPPEVVAFGRALMEQFSVAPSPSSSPSPPTPLPPGEGRKALGDAPGASKYWTEMVDWAVERIKNLVSAGVPPADIAVLAPYVEDVLRFELEDRLRDAGIRVRSVRPSRPLYDHPTVRALVALAKLAHPHWQLPVAGSELARALSSAIDGLDVARAQLIADAALKASPYALPAIEDQALWGRVGMRFFERYGILQRWMAEAGSRKPESLPLDLFWQQLFTDVLSQPGFAMSANLDGAMACDKLVRSARAFREVFEQAGFSAADFSARPLGPSVPGIAERPSGGPEWDVGLEYVTMLSAGVMAAQYAPEREEPDASDAILLAPVYTYLTGDHRSRYQFWLDINSLGWYERIYQPLTHPYVLSRRWRAGALWSEEDEHRERRAMLGRVVGGLAYRCSGRIYMASSQLGIGGQEESGPLIRAVQRVLRE